MLEDFLVRAGFTCASWLALPSPIQVGQASVWLTTGHTARESGTQLWLGGALGFEGTLKANGPDADVAVSGHPLAESFTNQLIAACLNGVDVIWTWPIWWRGARFDHSLGHHAPLVPGSHAGHWRH